ncbi:MAG: hypothetical protein RBT01_14295 [Anaerolineaceae bacterium]|jgi:hypothetical protein|nr:hypothetical protein [Anaerolineaceae bacterium]
MNSFYVSYLLRIWELDHHNPQQFLASLEKPGTRELINFKNIEELFEYLRKQVQSNRNSSINYSDEKTEV